MEFMTGVNKKETLEIGDLLTGSYEGKSVKVNGAVHTIRDMGEVAFIVLRKREGLLQCVYEEGKTQFDLKDLKDLVEATKDQDMTDAQVDEIKAAKEKLQEFFQTSVSISKNAISIHYENKEDLNRILELLNLVEEE